MAKKTRKPICPLCLGEDSMFGCQICHGEGHLCKRRAIIFRKAIKRAAARTKPLQIFPDDFDLVAFIDPDYDDPEVQEAFATTLTQALKGQS